LDHCSKGSGRSSISAQKNTFALDPEWGSLENSDKGTATKNNNRPPNNKKEHAVI